MPLTDTAIRGVKPPDKPQKLFLRQMPVSFCCSGTKDWRVKYRFQGREKLRSSAHTPGFR
jgi:hypothetical protein